MVQKKSVFRNFAMVSQLGLVVMAPVFLSIAFGIFMDSRLGTNMTFLLLVLGFIAGGRNGYMMAMRMIWLDKEEDDREHGTGD